MANFIDNNELLNSSAFEGSEQDGSQLHFDFKYD